MRDISCFLSSFLKQKVGLLCYFSVKETKSKIKRKHSLDLGTKKKQKVESANVSLKSVNNA